MEGVRLNPAMFVVQSIDPDSPAYRLECDLRQRVLRGPLGLDLFDEDLAVEREQFHHGLFEGERLIGCAIAVRLTPEEIKIRQMAVDPDYQGRGCGRQLLDEVMAIWKDRGIRLVSLNARLSVARFYERLGFSRTGAEFTEVGLPHVKMIKQLHGITLAGPRGIGHDS
ncbi:MAG: GNAT family N-acetyltransferase [Verrucomicrobiales bacterium]